MKRIVKEINNSTVYTDGWLVISRNYISSVNNYKKIVHLDNVINAYQQIVRTNGSITGRYIVIIDLNGKKIEYTCSKDEEKVLKALKTLSVLRDDIKMGYTQYERIVI